MLFAYANWGRWIADCPACNSAELVKPFGATARSRFFLCRECGHSGEIEMPGEVDKIEAALLRRPAARNRNWRPGETLEQLTVENVVHGVEDI